MAKCAVCSFNDNGTGDMAHVCKPALSTFAIGNQDELQALRQRNAELEADSIAADKLLDIIGLGIDSGRTDGGIINVSKAKSYQKETITTLMDSIVHRDKQILAQQDTINKMRDLLEEAKRCVVHVNKAILGKEYASANGAACLAILHLDETLALRPSTAELAAHDEAIRLEWRDLCAEVCNGYAFGYEGHMEGADRDDFIRFEFAKDAAIVMREAIMQMGTSK